MAACPNCGGTILADGYCDTCGAKAASGPPGAGAAAAPQADAPRRRRKRRDKEAADGGGGGAPPGAAMAGGRCGEPGCTGTVLPDGYCDTCGTKAAAPSAPAPDAPSAPVRRATGSQPLVTGSARARGSRRTTSTRTRASSRRTSIGAGLVDVPAAPRIDPSTVLLKNPEVAEDKRFCSRCAKPVGRSRGDAPGRVQGFCGHCRQPFDFVPKLKPGELVGRQYEVAGCLAHGGLGWIYLARDKAVHDRWVVLKGLLDAEDEAAMAAAVAERRFLAEVQHPSIVEIYNFTAHKGSGYIVMEYVGGPSLKQLLKQRRQANGGTPDPLPVPQAIAFVLAVLPAFAYLHGRHMVYCDFKPDNLIQVEDQVKLIDLGGVRRLDDPSGDVYGTVGFQAPEIAEMGPSIASDLYTIGRTLAVLTLDFRGYQSTFEHTLPDPVDHPALAKHDSFYRLLLKATAPHPDDRFQSVAELGDQLTGVLREVVATETRTPQPGPSSLFTVVEGSTLPMLAIDPGDPAAPFLANLGTADPRGVLAAIADAVAAQQVTETVDLRLRRVWALIETGDRAAADAELDRIEAEDPWEWRAVWLRGIAALAADDLDAAATAFDRCMYEAPGELAPELAAAITAERRGDLQTAAWLYDVVATVDPGFTAAANGLARCRLAGGDVEGAVAAYRRVPPNHRAFVEAQVAAVRALAGAGRIAEATAAVPADLGERRRAELEVDLLRAGLAHPAAARVDERTLRRSLEEKLRLLARLTTDHAERHRLIDEANAVRPLSLV
jgi:serine/threonine-protein kinase PknG